jgi:hypothetical protein
MAQDRRTKPWEMDKLDPAWEMEKFDPCWNEGGLLEVSSFSTPFPKDKGMAPHPLLPPPPPPTLNKPEVLIDDALLACLSACR